MATPEDDSYFTEPIWFGMQPEDGGLTQAEIDSLAHHMYDRPEITEGITTDQEQRRLDFMKWLVDNGHLVVGVPDGTAYLKKRLVHSPVPHVEWILRLIDNDNLPPAA